jgi:hypothetical protein
MPEAQKAPPAQKAAPAKEEAPAEKAKPKVNRSNFKEMWPADAKLTLNVTENPKKEGSKARERFQYYFTSKTVGDYLGQGGTYQDIAYDLGRAFIKVG